MPDEPFQRAWSEDLLCPWRIYEDGDGHLNCPNGLDQGQIRSRKSSIVMGAAEFSLVPTGSAGHEGGGGGLPTAASPQPDIFGVREVVGDRRRLKSENF